MPKDFDVPKGFPDGKLEVNLPTGGPAHKSIEEQFEEENRALMNEVHTEVLKQLYPYYTVRTMSFPEEKETLEELKEWVHEEVKQRETLNWLQKQILRAFGIPKEYWTK
jgi:hypothetical protein